MSVYAVVLAAGSGTRFGADKIAIPVRGKPLWKWSFDALAAHPEIDGVGLVCAPESISTFQTQAPDAAFVVAGGKSRVESSQNGIHALPKEADIVLIQDAARPIVANEVVSNVIEAVKRAGAAAPAIEATDTIRQIDEKGSHFLLDRRTIKLMQTPQGARVGLLKDAYDAPGANAATDEMALLESIGIKPEFVEGSPDSFKVTLPSDLARFAALLGTPEIRTGFGYDVHAFSPDPNRQLWIGGVLFENHPALEGHSDADVLIHAIVDSLLGAAGLGDIGVHFPNDDPRWLGKPSLHFLEYAGTLLGANGWAIRNIDATIIAESPKVMPRADEIRRCLAAALKIDFSRVSLKATTNEKLGAIGRGEGMAAYAVATIAQFP